MTGQNNPKKFKTELQSDAKVHISTFSQSSEKDKDVELCRYVESQGKDSIKIKVERQLSLGDYVVLTKDLPELLLYKGYLCRIIGIFSESEIPGQNCYEIEFDSYFGNDDYSRKSETRNVGFEFPSTCYVTIVLGKDLLRVESQDLYYRTYF